MYGFVAAPALARATRTRGAFTGARVTHAAPFVARASRVRPGGARMCAAAAADAGVPLVDLRGKRALVTGIANNRSIAWGIARQLRAAGAEIGVTFLPMNEKVEGKVRKLTEVLEPTLFRELDVGKVEDMEGLRDAIKGEWGGVDIVVHCLAYADRADLEGSFAGTSRAGFDTALGVSAYSLIDLMGTLKPVMKEGASVVTLSYLGAVRVVPNYNIMGVAKAALEASVRYLASELGPDGVRVNAISAGPIRTLASSAIGGIQPMIKNVEQNAPLRRTVTQVEVGNAAAFLLSPAASGITGQTIYVDAGYETMGAPHLQ